MNKLSFKLSWVQDKFIVEQMNDNVLEERTEFKSHLDAMLYISLTMAMCQTCQEEWTFTY